MRRRQTFRSLRQPRNVALDDKRSPMLRLLQDCVSPDGSVQPKYTAQFLTLFKAERLGYVDHKMLMTESGRAFVKRNVQLTLGENR